MEPIHVVLDRSGLAPLLRLYQEPEDTLKDIYPTWLTFTRAKDYVVARVQLPFHVTSVVGVYKDQVFEWTDLFMYGRQIHTDIACRIAAWCEEAYHGLDSLEPDDSTFEYADRAEEGTLPTVGNAYINPVEIRERLADSIFDAIFLSSMRAGSRPPTLKEMSITAAENVVNLLNGGHTDLPRMVLTVEQNRADIIMKKLSGERRFRNGDVVTLDTPLMNERIRKRALEITKPLDLDDKG